MEIRNAAGVVPVRGTIPVWNGAGWEYLLPGTSAYVLTSDIGTGSDTLGLKYQTAAAGSIEQAAYVIAKADASFTDANVANLGALTSGLLKIGVSAGIATPATASAGTDYLTPTGTAAALTGLSSQIDTLLGSTRGAILYRGAGGWAILAPGTNTYVIASQGAGADPHYVAPATGGSGASTSDTFLVSSAAGSADLSAAVNLGALSTGLMKITVSAGVATPSIAAGADVPSTGLTITQWGGALGTGSISSGTATFNLATYNRWLLTLDHTQTVTLALSNVTVGQQFTVALSQDSTGSCLVTWFTGIKWAGGSVPTLTTTASKGDLFTFLCVGAGSYWGMIAGQNF